MYKIFLPLSLSCGAALTSFTAHGEVVSKTFKASDVKSLNLLNGSGDALIDGKAGTDVKVDADKVKWHEGCSLAMDVKDGTLNVVVEEKSSKLFAGNCTVNFKISLPAQANLTLKTGSGDTKVDTLTGDVAITTGSGDVILDKITVNDLKIQSGSGDLIADGDLGPADIKVGSGDVVLTYRKAPAKGGLTLKAGSGDTVVRLPSDAKFKVDYKAGSGEYTTDFPTTDGAYVLNIKSGSGDLAIKKL